MSVRGNVRDFWQRVSNGLEVRELWRQFQVEARAGYSLYAREVDWEAAREATRLRRGWLITRSLFWAVLAQLTPARRVLLVLALILLVFPRVDFRWKDLTVSGPGFSGLAALILLVLLALELAERATMKRDLEIAREIQQWLSPEKPPQVPGYELAFSARPANTVAGDYYDAFWRTEESGRKLLLVVADVAGKSVPAALLMATFHAGLHALASSAPSLPALVEGLNGFHAARSLGGTRFTTAFCAELDPDTGALSYVNAGHNPPILRHAAGGIERLEVGGLPLGIRPEAHYAAGSTRCAPGDSLLVFTDGLVETVNPQGEEYGEVRLLGALRALSVGSPEYTLRCLLADVETFAAGTPQQDDITCLLLRALPAGGPAA